MRIKKLNGLFKALLIFTLSLAIFSCKKNEDDGSDDTNADNIYKKEYITIKGGGVPAKSLISTIKDGEGFTYNIFGSAEANGEIKQITALTIANQRSLDSVYNFVYDSLNNVRTVYLTVNGVKDTSLLGFDYKKDTTIITSYAANWSDNNLRARWQVYVKGDANGFSPISAQTLKKQSKSGRIRSNGLFNQTAQLPHYSVIDVILKEQGTTEQIKLALYAALTVVGTVAVLAGATATAPVTIFGVTIAKSVLIIGGFALDFFAVKGASSIAPKLFDKVVNSLLDIVGGKDASASELTSIPNGTPPDPTTLNQAFKDLITSILTTHTWKWESWLYEGNNDLDPCNSADIMTFQSNGAFKYKAGCEAGNPVYNYTWELVDDNKRIIFYDGGDPYPYLVLNISKDKITLQSTTENEVWTWKTQ
ncbi:MAG: lipocalin family protein [Flavisolibacter sp.]